MSSVSSMESWRLVSSSKFERMFQAFIPFTAKVSIDVEHPIWAHDLISA